MCVMEYRQRRGDDQKTTRRHRDYRVKVKRAEPPVPLCDKAT